MSVSLTKFTQDLDDSPTIAIKEEADKLRSQGKDVYDFGIGEMNPEVPLPQLFKDGITKALQNNETHYISPQGDLKLRELLCEDLKRNFNTITKPENIIIYDGPKDALFKICLGLLSPIDKRNRVVTFAPTYESFTHVPKLLTGFPSFVLPTSDMDFTPDLNELRNLLNDSGDSIALIILNSPSNPSGAVYNKGFLEEFAEIVKNYPEIAVISDEVYRTIVYEGQFTSVHSLLPEQTFITGGISKEVSGTGTRLGFAVVPGHLADQLVVQQGNTSSCSSLPIQRGFAHFLANDLDMGIRKQIKDRLAEKRAIMLHYFENSSALKDCRWNPPKGAFYFFPNITKYFGRRTSEGKTISTDEELSLYLLKSVGVVTIPGSKFSKPGYIRLAFASSSDDRIHKGCQLLVKAFEDLK